MKKFYCQNNFCGKQLPCGGYLISIAYCLFFHFHKDNVFNMADCNVFYMAFHVGFNIAFDLFSVVGFYNGQ